MPKRYSLHQKQHALIQYDQLGTATAASRATGIPARTIRDWISQRRAAQRHIANSPMVPFSGPVDLTQLRDNLYRQIHTLLENPTDDPRKAYYTSLAVTRLLNQIQELNAVLPAAKKPPPPPFER